MALFLSKPVETRDGTEGSEDVTGFTVLRQTLTRGPPIS